MVSTVVLKTRIQNFDTYIGDMLSVSEEIKSHAMLQIKQSQDYQKKYYDRRHISQGVE